MKSGISRSRDASASLLLVTGEQASRPGARASPVARMTCSACFIRNAASSDEPRFHGRSVAAAAAPPAPLSAPKPPPTTELNLRFIPFPLTSARNVPAPPTTAPANIIPGLLRGNPTAVRPHSDLSFHNPTHNPHTTPHQY